MEKKKILEELKRIVPHAEEMAKQPHVDPQYKHSYQLGVLKESIRSIVKVLEEK